MQSAEHYRDWLRAYDDVGREISQATTSGDALSKVTAAAMVTIPHAAAVSITRVHDGAFDTLASHGAANDADQVQYELNEGPCVEAAVEQTVFHSGDLGSDERWPTFGKRAAGDFGFHSVISVRMLAEPPDMIAGLNLYGSDKYVFTEESLFTATMLATHASAMLTALHYNDLAVHLQTALMSNREIGVAMGILMFHYKIPREQAFDLLRVVSQNTNRKLRDVAVEVADTGTLTLPPVPHGARAAASADSRSASSSLRTSRDD